jgi:hypothetical protein
MALDYTAWPTATQVYALLTASNITPGLSQSSDVATAIINGAAKEMERCTGRQFVAGSAGESRFFDGSGTGMMVVDDYITITAVKFYWLPVTGILDINQAIGVTRKGFANDRIQIIQGPPNFAWQYITQFPLGRSNIEVVGTWGYGATIPYDVWEAVLYSTADRIANLNRLSAQGNVIEVKDDDVTLKYDGRTVGESAGWTNRIRDVAKNYKRSLRDHLARQEVGLIY